MTGDTRTSDAAIRTAALDAADMAMIATACCYDLTDAEDMRRSVDELSHLFYQLSKVIEPDLFVEAGAKDAGSSRRARRRLDPKRIVAFEANPYTYKRFRPGFDKKPDGVEYLHLALSDSPGSVTFNVNLTEDGRPISDGQGSLLKHSQKATSALTEVTVDATTLDTFFADHPFTCCACWVDVEGASRNVLTGGRALFERAGTVIIEVEDRQVWPDQWLRKDVVDFFADCGMIPVARDFQSRYQYNVVFVRESLFQTLHTLRWRLETYHSAAMAGRLDRVAAAAKPAEAAAPASGQVIAQARRIQAGVGRRARRLRAKL